MTKKEQENILKKIKIAMLQAGFNQTSLARKMGKTQGAINKLLNGNSALSIKNLEQIATLTKKPLNYFFDNSTDVNITNSQIGHHNAMSPDLELEVLKQKVRVIEKELEGYRMALENMQLKIQRMQQKEK